MSKDKTRNNGRWTEARFRSFITSILRSGSRRWPPKYELLKEVCTGIKINQKSKRLAKHYKCANCSEEFTQTNVQVDHKEPIGSCKTWDEFIEKLFCEAENLQVLCKPCHKKKTKEERTVENKQDVGNTRRKRSV